MNVSRYIVHECVGCNKVNSSICDAYINPGSWFRYGKTCPLASHIVIASKVVQGKVRPGQQKQVKVR